MAVYTSITKEILSLFLEDYNIGSLENFKGVLEGVENTNYKIITSQDTFILTIFEKRVKEHELPIFIKFQNYLSKKNIKCPSPIPNRRNNGLHQKHWRDIFSKCQNSKDRRYGELYQIIEQELQYLDKNWPRNLPTGIIHGDIFPDNVFFIDNKISGLIDFYFSCNDFYAYELAITTNAWCFDKKESFKKENFNSLLKGYQQHVNMSNDEKNHFNTLLRGAAMRILVTRLHDQLYHPDGAMVVPKDPFEFFNILKWHQNNSIFDS